jgi:hypothetical protein
MTHFFYVLLDRFNLAIDRFHHISETSVLAKIIGYYMLFQVAVVFLLLFGWLGYKLRLYKVLLAAVTLILWPATRLIGGLLSLLPDHAWNEWQRKRGRSVQTGDEVVPDKSAERAPACSR